ncbi:MAG: hypothetical protein Q7K42_00625 [Candidatus Diapherotrites archaeon]|nr:hypothetical protein [Candidatus Diapherotrites archaeon]
MQSVSNVFVESFNALKNNPKLFLPKFLIAFLNSVIMLLFASTSLQVFQAMQLPLEQRQELMIALMPALLLGLVLSIASFVLDILINALYSVAVQELHEKKKFSLQEAFNFSLKKFFVVFPAAFAFLILFSLLSLPFSFAISSFLQSNNFELAFVVLLLFMIFVFFANALFFMLYPVAVFEKKNFWQVLHRSVELFFKNSKEISVVSLLPFFLSLASWILAFFAENSSFLILFIVGRFLLAVFGTYAYLTNPVFYFEFDSGSKA